MLISYSKLLYCSHYYAMFRLKFFWKSGFSNDVPNFARTTKQNSIYQDHPRLGFDAFSRTKYSNSDSWVKLTQKYILVQFSARLGSWPFPSSSEISLLRLGKLASFLNVPLSKGRSRNHGTNSFSILQINCIFFNCCISTDRFFAPPTYTKSRAFIIMPTYWVASSLLHWVELFTRVSQLHSLHSNLFACNSQEYLE